MFKRTLAATRAFVSAAHASVHAVRAFDRFCVQLDAVTASTHGYCTKCAVWLRLDVNRGRCTVCHQKLTPM